MGGCRRCCQTCPPHHLTPQRLYLLSKTHCWARSWCAGRHPFNFCGSMLALHVPSHVHRDYCPRFQEVSAQLQGRPEQYLAYADRYRQVARNGRAVTHAGREALRAGAQIGPMLQLQTNQTHVLQSQADHMLQLQASRMLVCCGSLLATSAACTCFVYSGTVRVRLASHPTSSPHWASYRWL